MAFYILEFEEFFVINGLIISMSLHFHLITFIDLHSFLDDVDFFDSKLNSAKFDNVSSLHHIFYLAILVLEASNY